MTSETMKDLMGKEISYEDLVKICREKIILGVSYGDFYCSNDNYPYLMERQ